MARHCVDFLVLLHYEFEQFRSEPMLKHTIEHPEATLRFPDRLTVTFAALRKGFEVGEFSLDLGPLLA